MPIHYDIETDSLYLKGTEKGTQIGIEKGIEIGVEKEAARKDYVFVRSLLLNTDFTDDKIADVAAVTLAFVQKVKSELHPRT